MGDQPEGQPLNQTLLADKVKHADVKLKNEELRTERSWMTSPLTIATVTGLLALSTGLATHYIDLKAQSDSEKQKREAATEAGKENRQTELILLALKGGVSPDAARSLQWEVDKGLIEDPSGRIGRGIQQSPKVVSADGLNALREESTSGKTSLVVKHDVAGQHQTVEANAALKGLNTGTFVKVYSESVGRSPGPHLEDVLSFARQDNGLGNLAETSYLLATILWETADTFAPIHELGSSSYFEKYEPGTPLGDLLGNTVSGDGYRFRGRGYIQIAGRGNYAHIGDLIGQDIVNNPDLVLDPAIAYQIASGGMRNGWFTGRRMSQYFGDPSKGPDFVNARRIVNGVDHAEDIAKIAKSILIALQKST